MNPTVIICVGNRFVPNDDLGCRVFDHLASASLPAGTVLVDGGLCGLDLLRVIEGKRRVVFADALTGMASTGEVVVLDRLEVATYAASYGHGAGLPYLLRLLPQVCPAPMPEIVLVGAQVRGDPNLPAADELTVRAVAARCLEVAEHGT